MNDAAKKIVGREARRMAKQFPSTFGDMTDTKVAEAWTLACRYAPRMAGWKGARAYFETILINELQRSELDSY